MFSAAWYCILYSRTLWHRMYMLASLCVGVSSLLYFHILLTGAQREENDSRLAMQRAVEEEEEARVAVKAAVGGNLYVYVYEYVYVYMHVYICTYMRLAMQHAVEKEEKSACGCKSCCKWEHIYIYVYMFIYIRTYVYI